MLARRCQQFPHRAGGRRQYQGIRVKLKALTLDIDFLLQLQKRRLFFSQLR